MTVITKTLAILAAGLCAVACNALWGVDRLDYSSRGPGAGANGSGGGGAGGSGGGGHGGGAQGGEGSGGGQGGSGGAPDVWCGDSDLIACFEFEGSAEDGSPLSNHGAGVDVTYVPGVVGQAADFGPVGRVSVPAHASLLPTAITMELWLRLDALPQSGTRMGILDNPGRYSLFVYDTGLRCSFHTVAQSYFAALPPVGEWIHVACTNDGITAIIYYDGVAVVTAAGASLITDPSAEPLAIGSNEPPGDYLDGAIDQLRVFSVARSKERIAQAASY